MENSRVLSIVKFQETSITNNLRNDSLTLDLVNKKTDKADICNNTLFGKFCLGKDGNCWYLRNDKVYHNLVIKDKVGISQNLKI